MSSSVAAMRVVTWVLLLLWFLIMQRLLSRLSRDHIAVHKELGEPSLSNFTLSNNLRVLIFLMTRKYRTVPDKTVQRLGRLALSLLVLMLWIGVAITASSLFA